MRKISQWIVSVSRHWGSLVTGGVLIGALGVWQGTDHHVPPSIYWIVAVLGLITASYRAWAVEQDAKDARQNEIDLQSKKLAEQDSQYKENIEKMHGVDLSLRDEVARLHAIQIQPRFRFIVSRRTFGAEECDALELWNDGATVEVEGIYQSSYVELSFAFDPEIPDDGERFASNVGARYGLGPGLVSNFVSILEERFNLNYAQDAIRHPTNPLGFEDNANYTLSLQDEWDLKYVPSLWERILAPSVERLGLANRVDPGTAAERLMAPDEQSPAHPHVRYIPSYYFHRRHYEMNKQPGRLVSLYAWADGNPGTNYTREFRRLMEDIYQRFGLDKVTVSRRTFLTLIYIDLSGARSTCIFDVHPRDPWGALAAKRLREQLVLGMGFEVDMRRITANSVLSLCSVPPALRSIDMTTGNGPRDPEPSSTGPADSGNPS